MTLCLVNNIGTENKRNCAAKRIFHYIGHVVVKFIALVVVETKFIGLVFVLNC